ncbi:hypothetical protein EV426DRAFT_705920 [Tirmania nivea]|nr:hypothetical protein EV426DRAFT_705920 [Tirmania nivea]
MSTPTSRPLARRSSAKQHCRHPPSPKQLPYPNAPPETSSADSDVPWMDTEEQPIKDSIQKLTRVGARSRSIFTIPEEFREATSRAAGHVRNYTFFENPMLNATELAQLILESWADALHDTGKKLERPKIIDSYLRSIHSRTRAHLVCECKRSIIEVYQLTHLSQPEIADNVQALLFQDRFICCQDGRQTDQRHFRAKEITEVIFRKYFSGTKMRGNFDDAFFNSINEVFICLVTSAMRHCLKGWITGSCEETPKSHEFKYETTIATYKRFFATCEAHSPRMRHLLLATIKADLRERLIAAQPMINLESDQPLNIDDSFCYEQELAEELARATTLPRRQNLQAIRQLTDDLGDSIEKDLEPPPYLPLTINITPFFTMMSVILTTLMMTTMMI